MSDGVTTVEATGADSSSRQTARINAAQALGRELNRRGLIDVGDVQHEIREARPGRFYSIAQVRARPRR